jgi:hypothetical protein
VNRPLIVAVPAALLGFGFWVWLTGPGTSVPNAVLALFCGIAFGRVGWWLAARNTPDESGPPVESVTPPPPSRRRAPPMDAEP